MTFSLRLKFGCLILLVVSWCLFMIYLVTSLEFQWMPPLPLLQSLQHHSETGSTEKQDSLPTLLNSPSVQIPLTLPLKPLHQNPTTDSTSTALPPTTTIQVVMATDSKSLGGLITAINSILSNTKHNVKFHIVITEEDLPHLKAWIRSSKLHSISYETHSLSAVGERVQSELQLVKASFGCIFPDLEGRVIYMDSDVIIQGDIWELHSVIIEPDTFGAFAQDCSSSSSRMAGAIGRPRYANFINMKNSRIINRDINGGLCPFTSGVFVANITEWKVQGVFEQLQNWLEIHSVEPITGIHPGVNAVEAAMLIVFYEKVTPLDPLWHVQHLGVGLNSRYSKQFIERAKLLHWSGHFKPWRHRAAHTEQWDRYFVPDPTLQFRPLRRRG
ncbi:hypothetical protein R5R35_006730 [Gryllus longicercus]|uniref:Glycosyltransferase n=2 Tax=Gryllus longicercus TaxID=2509291 RepID=A0AAN9ZFV6_9ORTH